MSLIISSGRKRKFFVSTEVAWYITVVSWNENGAGGRDWNDMLELIEDGDWIVVFEPDMGAA